MGESANKAGDFEKTLAQPGGQYVQLRLFVAGAGSRSARAIADFKRLCSEFLPRNCEVEIVDIYAQPERAMQAQIVAVPTLVREKPQPMRKFVGELGDPGRIARALGVMPA